MYYTIEGTVTALTPIHHGGDEKTGSTPVLRTIMVYVDGVGEVPIPYISGNSIRGVIRRMLVRDMLDTIGYNISNTRVYHALYSGGVLESTSDDTGVMDLAFRKKLRSMLPPVALLGCSLGNQIISGVLSLGHLFPLCEEYKCYLPPEYQVDERCSKPIRVFTDQAFITRRDDLRADREEDEQAVQMKVEYEAFVPGTRFYHWYRLQYPDELVLSCMGRALELLELDPHIGGRRAMGDGKVLFDYKNKPSSKLYNEYLMSEAEEIKKYLASLEDKF